MTGYMQNTNRIGKIKLGSKKILISSLTNDQLLQTLSNAKKIYRMGSRTHPQSSTLTKIQNLNDYTLVHHSD